jgi:hypothetical protein
MKIERTMDLGQLAERMGEVATLQEAEYMRACLVDEGFLGMDTADIPDRHWARLLGVVTAFREATGAT